MRSHKDLDVWNSAIELAQRIYLITRRFPREEMFGLSSQMRRSAVSIASNIAEGAARNGDKQFVHFLYVALGSASELETQVEISQRVGLLQDDAPRHLQEAIGEIRRMLHGLIKFLRERETQSRHASRVTRHETSDGRSK